MRVFMDFEASGLTQNSYPVEVAWVFEDERQESHLIRPAPGWTAWSASGEETHGISRTTLDKSGEPVGAVARRMVETLSGHDLFASAPAWDGKWLGDLLEAGGFPRNALTLRDTEVAQAEIIAETLGIDLATAPRDPGEELPMAVETIMVLASMEERRPHHHRALDDAQEERRQWIRVREMAEKQKGRLAG
ncbi:transcriptional regulator [Emcibacter sp. SYSU 3D8]|uniref:transcriptional regulator n=1 Tax=Emcibacter sp. SYSU 3D8 TaxID=3133969 RepID=UPI0031FEB55A